MSSTLARSNPLADGKLYDGVTAHAHDVRVEFAGDRLVLSQDGGWREETEAAVLKRIDAAPGSIRLSRSDKPGWRLALSDQWEEEVTALLGRPERYGRWIDRIGLVPALVAGAVVTASVVAIGYLAPQWIAPHVPESWERNVGTAIVGDFGDLRCRNSDGQRALQLLVERVAPGSTTGPDPIRITALDVRIFNAAALPGGQIVVFRPALAETEADALAGIIAHEVAHVRRRHVTEALIRELGIGALVRLFAGDLGANAQQLVALSYTRDNEAEADADAIAMLKSAGISPQPTAKLFERFAKEQGEELFYNAEFLNSHPASRGRAELFARSFDPRAQYRPALTVQQADAMAEACTTLPAKR
jgi:Zn-dependent protease with chaperone function